MEPHNVITITTWPVAGTDGLTLTTATGAVRVRHVDPDALRAELGPGSQLVLSARDDGSWDLVEHVAAAGEFIVGDLLV